MFQAIAYHIFMTKQKRRNTLGTILLPSGITNPWNFFKLKKSKGQFSFEKTKFWGGLMLLVIHLKTNFKIIHVVFAILTVP